MVMTTTLVTASPWSGPAEWEKFGKAAGPDRVVSGLNVSVVSGLTIRISPGRAMVGGYAFESDANVDVVASANVTGSTQIDRLVLRRSYNSGTGLVTITPVIRRAADPGVTITQLAFPGDYEIPLARWAVLNGGATALALVTDGPGPGAAMWTRGDILATNNVESANLYFNTLVGGTTGFVTTAARGPQPCSISGTQGDNINITQDGYYTITYRATMVSATVDSYIRLYGMPGEDWREPFQPGFVGHPPRASIVFTGFLPAGTTVLPKIYQNSGADATTAVTFKIMRAANAGL